MTKNSSSLAILVMLMCCNLCFAQIFNSSPEKSASTPIRHDPEVKQTAWPSIPMPKVTMPKVSMPDMSVITRPVMAGFSKVKSGTKSAWEGTKEMLTFGRGDATEPRRTSASQPKQGFWSRMFSSEPERQDGPQTVGEWMSQPRLDP